MADILIENKIEMRKINTIKPYVRNPRKNDKTVELLVQVIPKVGFNVPILIDDKGIIVKGHARYCAAIRLGMEEVPCIVTHADPEAIKADRITDNKISEFSEWVNEELLHELDMIDLDLDLTDFGLAVPVDDMPDFDDFVAEEDNSGISEEQKKALYEEFLRKQAEEQAKEVSITTQEAINKAQQKQKEVAAAPPQYYKCTCEKCGHVMFVRADAITNMDDI